MIKCYGVAVMNRIIFDNTRQKIPICLCQDILMVMADCLEEC